MTNLETNLALQLPVIDFKSQDLKPGTLEWDSVRGDVRRALEEYGCFEALFDKVSVELRKAVFKASEELFWLPLETKQRTVSEMKYRGYVGQNLYEGVGIDVADNEEKVNAFTRKLWPQGNMSFSETVVLFTKRVSELDLKIRRMIMESFGLEENYIEKHLKSTYSLMRMMKYRGVDETEEEELGMEAHTDRNVLTIVCQNHVADGLEVKTKDGNHWIKANPSQDSSLLVIGGSILHVSYFLFSLQIVTQIIMMMMMFSGTVERSGASCGSPCGEDGDRARYSAGLFSMPKTGDFIYAPEEMVDDEHPRLFKPFDFEAYYKFTSEGSGRRDLPALRNYCGLPG